jgi:hypothetical protein
MIEKGSQVQDHTGLGSEEYDQASKTNDPAPSATTYSSPSGIVETLKLKLSSDWFLHECRYDSCQKRWSAFATVDEADEDLKRRNADVPIIHNHRFLDGSWKTYAITIQDTFMRQVVTQMIVGYQDLDPELQNWEFLPPFRPFVHRWDRLKAIKSDTPAGPLKHAAEALTTFLTPILASSLASLAQTRKTGKLTFENAWQIFEPGSLAATELFSEILIGRVIKYVFDDGDEKNPKWLIDIEYIDWNGENTGYTTMTIAIPNFKDSVRVTFLPIFPKSYHNDGEKMAQGFLERGRNFERLRGYNHMLCSGTKVLLETEKPERRPVAGKVCIDANAYYRSCNLIKPYLRPLHDEEEQGTSDQADAGDSEDSDAPFESCFSISPLKLIGKIGGISENDKGRPALSDLECIMTSPWMKGFDLKAKVWCELRVNDLQEMTWNDEAFEKLVLPDGEKELAWSFVENKILSQGAFDDFIPNKGQGLIILMFGPPGVGKTFTAEAVAERSRVPLYSVSAGDLGTKPSEVEKALDRALDLCRMWDAMLLLDEADIFLGARTNDSLERNELVSSKRIPNTSRMTADQSSLPDQARILSRYFVSHNQSHHQHRLRVPIASRPVLAIPRPYQRCSSSGLGKFHRARWEEQVRHQ